MKKLYLFIVFSFLMLSASAQDVIVTKQSERIDCKVIEISETQVSYKKNNNPNGPLFTMSSTRVASIIFENGEVYTFKDVPAETDQTSNYNQEANTVPSWQDEPEVETLITLSSGKVVTFRSGNQVEFVNGKTYYGDNELKISEYEDFLRQTCTAAYQEALESKRLAKISNIFAIPGAAFAGIALYKEIKPMINGSAFEDDFDLWNEWWKPVLIWLGAALGCMTIELPILNRSATHSENARAIFNRDCSQAPRAQSTAQLHLGISPMGAGLTLTF